MGDLIFKRIVLASAAHILIFKRIYSKYDLYITERILYCLNKKKSHLQFIPEQSINYFAIMVRRATHLHFYSSSTLVIMTHQIREKCHVVGHFHTSGNNNWFTREKTVPSYEGEKNTCPQKCKHFHFLQIPAFTTWLGLIALFILRFPSKDKMFKFLISLFYHFERSSFPKNEFHINYCKNNQEGV